MSPTGDILQSKLHLLDRPSYLNIKEAMISAMSFIFILSPFLLVVFVLPIVLQKASHLIPAPEQSVPLPSTLFGGLNLDTIYLPSILISKICVRMTTLINQMKPSPCQILHPTLHWHRLKLRYGNEEMRYDAAESLAQFKCQCAVSILTRLSFQYALVNICSSVHHFDRVTTRANRSLHSIGLPPDQELIDSLNSITEKVRNAAFITLLAIGKPAQDILFYATTLNDSSIRRRAMMALAEMSDPRVLTMLVKELDSDAYHDIPNALKSMGVIAYEVWLTALGHRCFSIRKESATALGQIRDRRAIPYLKKSLTDDDFEVRECAYNALQTLGWHPESEEDKCIELIIQQKFAEAAKLGPSSLNHLGLLFTCPRKALDIRLAAGKELGKISDGQKLTHFATALRDHDEKVVELAVSILNESTQLIPEEAIRPLTDALCCKRGPYTVGQREVIWNDSTLPHRVRGTVVSCLANCGSQAVTQLVITSIDLEIICYEGSLAAKEAVIRIGKAAIQPIVEALTQSDAKIFKAARDLGFDLLHTPPSATNEIVISPVKSSNSLNEIRETAFKELEPLLKHENADTRSVCAELIAETTNPKAVELLIKLAQRDIVPYVRSSAVKSLGRLGNPDTIPCLANTLRIDAQQEVRIAAANSLGQFPGTSATSHLIDALQSEPNPAVRVRIVEMLGLLGNVDAVEPLVIVVKTSMKRYDSYDESLFHAAVESLIQLKDARPTSVLIQALQLEDKRRVKAAVEALGKLGDSTSIEPLVNLLYSRPDRDRSAWDNAWALEQVSLRHSSEITDGVLKLCAGLEDIICEIEHSEEYGDMEFRTSFEKRLFSMSRIREAAVRERKFRGLK